MRGCCWIEVTIDKESDGGTCAIRTKSKLRQYARNDLCLPMSLMLKSSTHQIYPSVWVSWLLKSRLRPDAFSNASLCISYPIMHFWFHHLLFLLRRLRNSSRVLALDLIAPSMQLVVVEEAVFCAPRITMHR